MNTTCPDLLNKVRILRNQEAWATFVQVYHRTVIRWIRQVSNGRLENELEDVAQEVFLIIFTRIQKFERERIGSLRGWMKAIVRNVVLKRLDPSRKITSLSLTDEFDVVDHDSVEEKATDRLELIEQAKTIIRKDFKEKSWQAFEMIYVEGKNPGDVSETLAISENAVYIATSRILAKLRATVDQFIEAENEISEKTERYTSR